MAALIQSKVTPKAAVGSMTTGHRFGASEAQAVGIVDAIASEADLLGAAVAHVEPLAGKSSSTLGKIKVTMYAGVVQALNEAGA